MPEKASGVSWAPAARNDLREIWRYYVRVGSPEIADRLLRDIARASERIRLRPLAWRERYDVMPGLRSILVPPYVLFYRVKADTIEVVRVVHQRRNLAALFATRKR
jgi:toxin ParE1/3/4